MKILLLIKNNPLRTLLSVALALSVWDSYHWRGIAYQQRDTMADLNDVINEQNAAVQQVSSECTTRTTNAVSEAVRNMTPPPRPATDAKEFNEWLDTLR